MKKILKITAIFLIMAGSFYSCEKNNDIDMSKIDFSNIESLYEQPLPVIQKCVQGEWKLQYTRDGFGIGEKNGDPYDTYMHLTEKRIIIDRNNGVNTDSPIKWVKSDSYGIGNNIYVLKYNYSIANERLTGNTLIPIQIANDTLVTWDGLLDNYLSYYFWTRQKS